MSTAWDVWCVGCGEGAGITVTNYVEGVAELIRQKHAIASLLPAKDAGVEVEVKPWFCNHVPIAWFAKHAGHELRPKDEYGRFDGACREHVDCPSCGRVFSCAKDRGHEEPHANIRSPSRASTKE
jgi:hypothetical protein